MIIYADNASFKINGKEFNFGPQDLEINWGPKAKGYNHRYPNRICRHKKCLNMRPRNNDYCKKHKRIVIIDGRWRVPWSAYPIEGNIIINSGLQAGKSEEMRRRRGYYEKMLKLPKVVVTKGRASGKSVSKESMTLTLGHSRAEQRSSNDN